MRQLQSVPHERQVQSLPSVAWHPGGNCGSESLRVARPASGRGLGRIDSVRGGPSLPLPGTTPTRRARDPGAAAAGGDRDGRPLSVGLAGQGGLRSAVAAREWGGGGRAASALESCTTAVAAEVRGHCVLGGGSPSAGDRIVGAGGRRVAGGSRTPDGVGRAACRAAAGAAHAASHAQVRGRWTGGAARRGPGPGGRRGCRAQGSHGRQDGIGGDPGGTRGGHAGVPPAVPVVRAALAGLLENRVATILAVPGPAAPRAVGQDLRHDRRGGCQLDLRRAALRDGTVPARGRIGRRRPAGGGGPQDRPPGRRPAMEPSAAALPGSAGTPPSHRRSADGGGPHCQPDCQGGRTRGIARDEGLAFDPGGVSSRAGRRRRTWSRRISRWTRIPRPTQSRHRGNATQRLANRNAARWIEAKFG